MTLRSQTLQTVTGETEPAFVEKAGTYARLRGKSRQTGMNWNKAGLIAWVDDDEKPGAHLVDVAASDRLRLEHQNPVKRATPAHAPQPAAPASPEPSSAAPATPGAAAQEPAGGGDVPAASGAAPDALQAGAAGDKAKRERIARMQAEADWAERMGALAPVQILASREAERMAGLRGALMRIGRDAAEKANPKDPALARAAIDEAVRAALADFIGQQRQRLEAEAAASPPEQLELV